MAPDMEYAPGSNPYSAVCLPGYIGGAMHIPSIAQHPNNLATLLYLYNQKTYLEDLLSQKATILHALRDKHSRIERSLSVNTNPRSKRKKVEQNRWRTERTIKTCEDEERAILDCLRVCSSNIKTLDSIINPTDASSSYMESASTPTDFDWNGWADGGDTSPFLRKARRPAIVDDISPETCILITGKKGPPLPPRSRPTVSAPVPPAPPNTARTQCTLSLSPTAPCFEPRASHEAPSREEWIKDLDKLSISGLLASKRVRRLETDRDSGFLDGPLGRMWFRLSGKPNIRTSPASRRPASWGPEKRQRKIDGNTTEKPIWRSVSAEK